MGSLTSQVLSSSFLLLLIRFIQRSIGLVSTLILARLLTPDDFGIVAIAVLVIHFCEVLSNAGSQQYIIQLESVCSEDINTAWSLDLVLKSILWLALVALVPLISSFYDRPELTYALYLSSTTLLIGAFKSPGLILLRRALDYKPIFKISIYQKLISFAVVMLIVYFEPTYWALIVGDVVSAIVLTIGSYFIHPTRPSFSLSKAKEQWAFSQWILLKGGIGYTRAQVDTILASKFFTADELGAYHLARHLSIMPSTDIIAPAIEPLMAAFARVKNDAAELAYQLSLSMLVVSLLIVPASVFMWFFPERVIDFFLGDQWANAYPVLSSLSILLFTIAIGQVLGQCCIALGKVRALFIYDLLSLFFVFTFLYSLHNGNLEDFALLRGLLGLLATTALLGYLSTVSAISILRLLKVTLPITISAFLSAYILGFFDLEFSNYSALNLSISLGIFGLVYSASILCFYISFYRHTREGKHLYDILRKTASQTAAKLF